jgi:hypothetical protein
MSEDKIPFQDSEGYLFLNQKRAKNANFRKPGKSWASNCWIM